MMSGLPTLEQHWGLNGQTNSYTCAYEENNMVLLRMDTYR